jgi:hypothetical protein
VPELATLRWMGRPRLSRLRQAPSPVEITKRLARIEADLASAGVDAEEVRRLASVYWRDVANLKRSESAAEGEYVARLDRLLRQARGIHKELHSLLALRQERLYAPDWKLPRVARGRERSPADPRDRTTNFRTACNGVDCQHGIEPLEGSAVICRWILGEQGQGYPLPVERTYSGEERRGRGYVASRLLSVLRSKDAALILLALETGVRTSAIEWARVKKVDANLRQAASASGTKPSRTRHARSPRSKSA